MVFEGYRKLRFFINGIDRRILQHDDDCAIAVTGRERVGKSDFALASSILLYDIRGEKINRVRPWMSFLNNNIGYRVNEIVEKITALPPKNAFVCDEAIRGMYKTDFITREGKEIVKVFAQIGMKNDLFFFCIPRFWDLIENIRNHRVKFWVHIVDRGYAVVFEREENIFSSDPWFRTENENILSYGGRFLKRRYFKKRKTVSLLDDPREIIERYSTAQNFLTWFKFPHVPNKIWDMYEKMSEARKMEKYTPPDKFTKERKILQAIFENMKKHKYSNQQIRDMCMEKGEKNTLSMALINKILHEKEDSLSEPNPTKTVVSPEKNNLKEEDKE